MRLKRNEAWKDFSSKTKGPKAVSSLMKTLQAGNRRGLEIIATQNRTPDETLHKLMETHFPDSTVRRPEEDRRGNALAMAIDLEDSRAAFISTEKLRHAIRTAKPFSAPGPDQIKPFVLRQLGPIMLDRLCRLFKASLLSGYTPELFRRSSVVFLPKAGRRDYANPRAYRPISLSLIHI